MDSPDAHSLIEQTARDVLRGYPLPAGLTSVSDAINQLPAPRPFPPTLLPATSDSLRAGPDEPLFQQYEVELAALLSSAPDSNEVAPWRKQELARVVAAMGAEVDSFKLPGFGGVHFPPSPFPLSSTPAAAPAPTTLATHLLDALAFPTPSPIPPPRSTAPSASDSDAFFASFLDSHAPPRASTSQIPPSSPDPLSFASKRATPPPTAIYSPKHSSGSTSYTLEIPLPTKAQRKALEAQTRLTESQRARDGSTPGNLGVESPMKRVKLKGSDSASTSDTAREGTGRGAVRVGEAKDVVERFSDLLSDIFSTDDSLIADTSSTHLPTASASTAHDFFRPPSSADGLPLLQSSLLAKLLKLLTSVRTKGRGEDLVEEVEDAGVGRLLKMLERSWRGAEEGTYWGVEALASKSEEAPVPKPKKGKKKAAPRGSSKPRAGSEDEDGEEYSPQKEKNGARSSRSRSRSPTVRQAVEEAPVEMDTDEVVWSDDALNEFAQAVDTLADGILAIRVALSLLTIARLPQQLYSADSILSILSTLRHALDSLLFPLLEASSPSHLSDLASLQHDTLLSLSSSLESAIPLLELLVRQEEMSEDIVISALYFSLSPFFHESPPASGKGKKAESGLSIALKGVRLASLGLVRGVFGRYADQRAWVIEEVLGHLPQLDIAKKGKGGFRLRTGATIHTVSALILQLVQTSPPDLREQVRAKLATGAATGEKLVDVEMRDSQDEVDEEVEELEVLPPLAAVTRDILDPALDSANKSARSVMNYLLQKCCSKSGKAAAGSVELEYRAVFDNLVSDLLATLHLPEWPAAELMLTVCCKSMMATLADPKTSHESNALKGVSLDHLGPIAARICQDFASSSRDGGLKTLQEIIATSDVEALDALATAQHDVLAHLSRSDRTGTSEDAGVFTSAIYGRDLSHALTASTSLVAKFSEEELVETKDGQRAKAVHDRLESLASKIWSLESEDDVFGPTTDDNHPKIDKLTMQLSRAQPLAGLYDALLERILDASESTQVGFRTKSLRGIGLIVAQDPILFLRADVRNRIEHRMLDSSPAVRDTAIELVGKYVAERPDLAVQYLPQISERITDTGLGVRRRVVKLLKTLYSTVSEEEQRVDICRKLVWRVLDEDDGIKELAVATLEDLWFTRALPSGAHVDDDSQNARSGSKSGIAQLAQTIMTVTGVSTERPAPVDEVLRQIIAKHTEKGTTPPLKRLLEVTESLIDGLVEDVDSLNVVDCIKTIYILNSAAPSLLSTAKATLLLPFLKSATTADEQLICDYLLKIFRSTVIAMPKTSSKFAGNLQAALLPMLNRPSSNLTTLQEIVSCFCAVVRGQTHDFTKMIVVLKACAGRLQGEIVKLQDPATAASANLRMLPTLCHLSALLCEHGNFDQIRSSFPETKAAIDAITPRSMSDFIFHSLITLYNLPIGPAAQFGALTSLGFLYRAYPTFMLKQGSTKIMDTIFASPNPNSQIQLLRILQDFLASQGRVAAPTETVKAETGVKIDELVGNVDGFADSGVDSAVCQRYIVQIIASSLAATNTPLQRLAVDVLTSVARSGFSHPLSISPTLVALTASPDSHLASKAYATLTLLHQKHVTLLATRFAEPAKATHGYMKGLAGAQVVKGYAGEPHVSHFGRWYTLIREKRNFRLDFLKTLSRTFELEPGAPCSEDDLSLARFTAEAISSLDLKTQEEPMSIISYLNAALAVSGLQVLHLLEMGTEDGGGLLGGMGTPSGSPSKGASPSKVVPMDEGEDGESQVVPPSSDLARQSVVCGVALLLRDHLKRLYSITDAKLAKFVLGKKSAMGDRATTRRFDAPLALGSDNYERMPFAIRRMETPQDLVAQRDTYISMIQDDGTIGAIDELEVDEDA